MNIAQNKKYVSNFVFPFCDEVTKYDFVMKIGQGKYGEVWKAKTTNNKFVAVKKINVANEFEGFPITAIREINILKKLKHENIVRLIEVCRSKAMCEKNFMTTIFLIFEFCEHDLGGLLSNINIKFTVAEIKQVLKMLFQALFFMHSNKLIHRDVKPANILISKNGVLKLADFSLARSFNIKEINFTNAVVTLWYRSPELLLGDHNYGPAIDMWAAGCVMAEMWTRSPILQGSTEQRQLNYITQLCGSITPEVWPGVAKLSLYDTFKHMPNQKRKVFKRLKPYVHDLLACNLLDQLLVLDPKKRIDANVALNHNFFWRDPMPTELDVLLSKYTDSMFEFNATHHDNQENPRPSFFQQYQQLQPVTDDLLSL